MAQNVSGFSFTDEDLAALAKKEVEGVKYVRSKVDMSDPAAVLAVYQKMIRGRMFQTQVGIAYLKELQYYLLGCDDIDKRAIIPIPVSQVVTVTESPAKVRELERQLADKNKWLFAAVAGIFILLVLVVVMLVIASTSGSTTILNYENEIINKYSAWEQELSEREHALSQELNDGQTQDIDS